MIPAGLLLLAAVLAGFPINRAFTRLRKDNRRLRTMLASAEADATQARVELAEAEHVADGMGDLTHAAAGFIQNHAWLPTIKGVGLDLIESLPVGHRIDWADFDAGTPIGLGVLDEQQANVVPIGGRSS